MNQSPLPRVPKALVSGALIFILVALDQITKWLAAQYLRGRPGHSYLGDTIRLEYAENSGAFLSLGASLGEGARTLLFVIGVMVIIGFCVVWLVRTAQTWLTVVALSLVIAGGLGNLIDRVSRGSVIDFLYFGLGPLHTGILNVADMAITGGLLLMLYDQYVLEKRKR